MTEGGFRRMQIVEVSDSDSDSAAPAPKAQPAARSTGNTVQSASASDVKNSQSSGGWRRMEIVEASDEESDEASTTTPQGSTSAEEASKAAAPPAAAGAPEGGFRRMQIVEASDDESDEAAPNDKYPEINVERSRAGIEKAKDQGNQLFTRGSPVEAIKWFSKSIWLISQDAKLAKDVPVDLHSVLHSNRALAHMKLKNWKEVDEDCSKSLDLKADNTKAKYRRASARFELGQLKAALADVEEVLVRLPDANSRKEAASLKDRIVEALGKENAPASISKDSTQAAAEGGFRRMQIVEVSDSDEEEPPMGTKAIPPAAKASPTATGGPTAETPGGFRRMQIVEVSDDESDEKSKAPAKDEKSKAPAKDTAPKVANVAAPATKASPASTGDSASQVAGGFRRMQIVEVSDEESEEGSKAATEELLPEIKVEGSKTGIERAKDQGNQLFAKGAHADAANWFSKCIWLIGKDAKLGKDVPQDLQSVLHSNRAYAYIKLKKWVEAEEDCSKSLALKNDNVKAKYRRAMARFELGQMKSASEDIEEVLAKLPDPNSRKEAGELKDKIVKALDKDTTKNATAAQAPSSEGGFRRMQIVEVSDSDEDEAPKVAKATLPDAKTSPAAKEASKVAKATLPDAKTSPAATEAPKVAKATLPDAKASPPATDATSSQAAGGFRRMQIVEASDEESDEGHEAASGEMFPEIKVTSSRTGIEGAKDKGNQLFAKGEIADAANWFSKCIWLISKDAKLANEVPQELRAVLHSNRANAYIKLQKWAQAEEDCSKSLALKADNVKAKYRRAMARFELGQMKSAHEDVEEVLAKLPDANSRKEAGELKDKILKALDKDSTKTAVPAQAPASEGGFRRMQIVEASDSDEDEATNVAKTTSPTAKPSPTVTGDAKPQAAGGFRRMEIVEASDEESDEGSKAAEDELLPEIKVESSKTGIEKAKDHGNQMFAKGAHADAANWFSKCIWVISKNEKLATDIPQDLRSILHSNRAYAYIKLKKWAEAEEDCSKSLTLKPENMKAKYRRAMARFELGQMKAAQEDIEELLAKLPDDNSRKEARDLKDKIVKALEKDTAKDSVAAKPPPSEGGFRRMQIVEASDSDEDEAPKPAKATSPVASTQPVATGASKSQDVGGFRRMQIVEASDEESDEGSNSAVEQLLPEIKVEGSKTGIEKAKDQGNQLFAKGSFADAANWFSKCIWLISKDAKLANDIPQDLRSVLHSNRAYAYIKLKKWSEAEEDCSTSLALKADNVKAKYRRAMARFELGQLKSAREDIEDVLTKLPDANSRKEAGILKDQILKALDKDVVAAQAPPSEGGFRRMQIVEASDSDEDETPKVTQATSPAATTSPAKTDATNSQVAGGFRRMQIVEASDDESDEASKAEAEELLPEIKVESSKAGIERAKDQGNQAFAKGAPADAANWFSKCIWLLGNDAKLASSVSQDLRAVLHSNRAFAYIKLQRWAEAEDDCSKSLAFKADNMKAKYRRAMARFELGQMQSAREDIEEVLTKLSDANSRKEAGDLKEKIVKAMSKDEPPKVAQTTPLAANASPPATGASDSQAAGGFRRMQIVEASDDESDEGSNAAAKDETSRNTKATSPAAKASPPATGDADSKVAGGFKRMQIVEASDEESDEGSNTAVEELLPEIKVEASKTGIEIAKDQGNKLFAKGAPADAANWFSKCIWLIGKDAKLAEDISQDLRSVLHSNRAYAYIKLKKWVEAEEDCSKSLALKADNVKAKYRRAMARLELGQMKSALEDIEEVLTKLPDANSRKEAGELKDKIVKALDKDTAKDAVPAQASVSEGGFRRMQIVEASDSDEEEASNNTKATSPAAKASPPATGDTDSQVAGGFKRMQIVEASDEESDAGSNAAAEELLPEIKVEANKAGIEGAKDQGNKLFAKGALADAANWFSKCIWLIGKDAKLAKDIPQDLQSVLHSNRAYAYIKLKKWVEAEEDCSKSLALKTDNVKAKYRRAMARHELGQMKSALEDIEEVLTKLPDANSKKEAADLKDKIVKAMDKDTAKDAVAAQAPVSEGGFRRMQIVEASDSDEDEAPKVANDTSHAAKTPPAETATTNSPDAGGFRQMQIVEASDDESEEDSKNVPEELLPEIKVVASKTGIEKAKDQGNQLFAKGAPADAANWFSKCIWLIGKDAKLANDIPQDLRSILHSNRAYAYIKMKKFAEAEEDCSKSLTFKADNVKAKYRRAMARFELGQMKPAREDIEDVLVKLPDANSRKEAGDLKDKIVKALDKETAKDAVATQPPPSAKDAVTAQPAPSEGGFRRMQIVEASDSDEEEAPKVSKTASPAGKASPIATTDSNAQDAGGFKRMQIEEASDEESDEGSNAAAGELLPEIKVEGSKTGIEKAKDQGNQLFAKGSPADAANWFSKCIWLIDKDAKLAKDIPQDLRSILHSNRAYAYIKLKKWAEAEEDCSKSLAVKADNVKAKYRRAMARFELGKMEFAREDIEEVLAKLPDANSRKEAGELKDKIINALAKEAAKPAVTTEAPPLEAGFKRMQIEEVSDSEEDAPIAATAASPSGKTSVKEGQMQVHVHCLSGEEFDVELEQGEVVGSVRSKIAKHLGVSVLMVGLVYNNDKIGPDLDDSVVFKNGDHISAIKGKEELFPEIEIELSRNGIEKAKDNANRLFAQGMIAESEKCFLKCIWLIGKDEELLKQIPNDMQSILHSNCAFAQIKLGKWAEADQSCSEALSFKADNMKAKYRRALARFELGQMTEALEDAKAVSSALPGNPEISELIDQINEKMQQPPPETATEVVEPQCNNQTQEPAAQTGTQMIEAMKSKANALFANGQTEEAVKVLTESIALVTKKSVAGVSDEMHSILHSNRALAHIKLQRWQDAEADCDCALLLNAENVKAKYRRALARFELGKVELASQEVEKVLKEIVDPNSNKEAVELKKRITDHMANNAKTTGIPSEDTAKDSVAARSHAQDHLGDARADPPKLSPGFKKMEIVEVDDADDKSDNESTTDDEFSDIRVERSEKGLKTAKDHANRLFADGDLNRSLRWFSKCICLTESRRIPSASQELRSILHSNRGLVYVKLEEWTKAEADCLKALELDSGNMKALFRRAVARFELGKTRLALEDANKVLKALPNPDSHPDAVALKKRIEEKLVKEQSQDQGDTRRVTQENSRLAAPGNEIAKSTSPKGAEKQVKPQQTEASAELQGPGVSADGWRRLEIVEASDDEESDEEEGDAEQTTSAARAATSTIEEFPDIQIDHSKEGIEEAKTNANSLFAKGSFLESARWFSKCLWLVSVKRVGVPADLHSILFSNRAYAYVKLKEWEKAEADCSAALELNNGNMKAQYRRAAARYELDKAESAMEDILKVIEKLPNPQANPEAIDLKKQIEVKLAERQSISKRSREVASEFLPEIKIERSKRGIEQGKDQGNRLFADGCAAESVKWFSKCIWLVENDATLEKEIPADLRSVLHSNRAFAHLKLEQWTEAAEDCSASLLLNKSNRKAKYRRAWARYELGKLEYALRDAEELLVEFSSDRNYDRNREETEELKKRILLALSQKAPAPRADDAGAAAPQNNSQPTESSTPPPSPSRRVPEAEKFPELHMEFSKQGVEQAREKANSLFGKGSIEDASRWFSKCLWAIDSGLISDDTGDSSWRDVQRTALHSNRAFTYIKLGQWLDAETDCSAALALNPTGVKALYRRGLARIELGNLEMALEDLDKALQHQPDNAELRDLRESTRKKIQGKATAIQETVVKTKAKPAVLEETKAAASIACDSVPSPTASAGSQSPLPSPSAKGAARGRGRVLRSAPAPSVPKHSPMNSVELLRNFHSMQRHPDVLARYVRERVPPNVVMSLFTKAPIEPDDLATLLSAIRTNAMQEEDRLGPEVVAEYLKQLLRTRTADIQFGMLSDSEKQVVRDLLALVSASLPNSASLQASVRKVID